MFSRCLRDGYIVLPKPTRERPVPVPQEQHQTAPTTYDSVINELFYILDEINKGNTSSTEVKSAVEELKHTYASMKGEN